MSAERSTITATTQIVFTFGPNNEERFDAHRALNHASEFLREFLRMVNEPNTTVDLPLGNRADLPTLQFLNKFMKYVDENLHDELREHGHENYFWSRKLNIKSVRTALQELFQGVDHNTIMTATNLADYLMIPSFIVYCSMLLHDKVRSLEFPKLCEYFGTTNDFRPDLQQLVLDNN